MCTFKIKENSVLTPPWLTLADNDGSHNLLSELGLTLLYGGNNEVTGSSSREAIEATLVAFDGNDVKVLCTRVIAAVDDGCKGKGWEEKGC